VERNGLRGLRKPLGERTASALRPYTLHPSEDIAMTFRPVCLSLVALLAFSAVTDARPVVQGDPLPAKESDWVDRVAAECSDALKAIRHETRPWKELYGGVIMGFFGTTPTNSPNPIRVRVITLEFERAEVRRLWFQSKDDALLFGAYVDWYDENGMKAHLLEIRGKQAVLLRGEVLEDPAPATATLRSAAWADLAAPSSTDLIAITRGWESMAVESVQSGPLHRAWEESLIRLVNTIAQGNPASSLIKGKRVGVGDFEFWGSNFAGRLVRERATVFASSSNAGSRDESARLSATAEALLREAQTPPPTPTPVRAAAGAAAGAAGRIGR
jgi:hypothetical protein